MRQNTCIIANKKTKFELKWIGKENRPMLEPRVLIDTPGRLNYPDGFVSDDGEYLHFAFDDNRHRAVYVGAKLPPK